MKVLYLWDSDYPWDIRVEKTCETLLSNQWEVHLVCGNRKRRPVEETYEGIQIHRMPFLSKKLGIMNDILTFPVFFSPVWLKRIYQVCKSESIDIIIARDLPMALAAIAVGKMRGIPVILDMAECYPELIRLIWKFEPFRIQNIFVRNIAIVDLVERIVLRHIDHVFVMVEESRQRLLDKNFPDSKITIVSNTPIIQKFSTAEATYPGLLSAHRNGKLILLYVGLLNHSRGLDTVIESLAEYVRKDSNVYLVILGSGKAENFLKNLVKELELDEFVGFEGWVDNKRVPEYVASSDICLVPHHKCSHWDNTIPNKLFDYMATGKPVFVSNAEPTERIVHETECGLVYRDYDKSSFVTQLMKLRDKTVRNTLGNNGIRAINEFYNWNNDSSRMLSSMRRLVKNETRDD